MSKLSETSLTVINSMQQRKTRIQNLRTSWHTAMQSQRVDALYLVDQEQLTLGEIALYAGTSRVTLDRWRAERDEELYGPAVPPETDI